MTGYFFNVLNVFKRDTLSHVTLTWQARFGVHVSKATLLLYVPLPASMPLHGPMPVWFRLCWCTQCAALSNALSTLITALVLTPFHLLTSAAFAWIWTCQPHAASLLPRLLRLTQCWLRTLAMLTSESWFESGSDNVKRPVIGSIPPLETSVLLFPRRKAGDPTRQKFQGVYPMCIERDSIVALFDSPQAQAAQHLGISITALKQVCRKLGVSRWPFCRGKKRTSTLPNALRASFTINEILSFNGEPEKASWTVDELDLPSSKKPNLQCRKSPEEQLGWTARRNELAAAAQGTYLHWDGWMSAEK